MIKNQLSIYHRAFKSFLQELQTAKADRKLQEAMLANQQEHKAYLAKLKKAGTDPKLREAIMAGYKGKEHLDATRFSCTVETDWIERIEAGLPYLEKAVMENRQFILQNGNTVLIEQAKRISKTSVEHLAHHSEMITHMPEPEQDLIPDKIYVVENTDNYAVYENRFLYMLLCYLQDFVDTRYSGIVKVWSSFSSELAMDKTVRFGKRNLQYSIVLREDAENDETTSYDTETAVVLERIRRMQQQITSLLNMPLMIEVSHAPMLKPPVTRTNVLRMDTNFREAVALYDYLVEYHKEGYLVQEMHQTMEPFTPEALEDFAEILASLSYLTYRYGGNLMEEMEQDYLAEERILKELHDREAIAQLAQMKKNMAASGKSMEQYLLALEQRNVVLEKDRVEQRTLEARLQERDRKIHDQQNTCRKLELSVADLEHEVAQQTAAMERLNAQREQELQQAREAHNRAMEKKQEQMDALEDQLTFVRAQLHGLRKKNGLIAEEDDYSSREMFAELEKEYAAFRRFFEGQWKQTKKNIRKNTIWKKKTPAEGDISEDIAEKMTVTADASNPEKDGE